MVVTVRLLSSTPAVIIFFLVIQIIISVTVIIQYFYARVKIPQRCISLFGIEPLTMPEIQHQLPIVLTASTLYLSGLVSMHCGYRKLN